jgi:DNA invertase Pin-like site-specific DNA recombinase
LPSLIFAILGIAAKLECRRILERTALGWADAKANGVKFGRKSILTPHQQKEAGQRFAAGETQRRWLIPLSQVLPYLAFEERHT